MRPLTPRGFAGNGRDPASQKQIGPAGAGTVQKNGKVLREGKLTEHCAWGFRGGTGQVLFDEDGRMGVVNMGRLAPRLPLAVRLLIAGTGPGLVTALALLGDPPSLALVAVLYLLAVVVAAALAGATAGMAASFIAFVLYDHFFTPPSNHLTVKSLEDMIALTAFLIILFVMARSFSSASAAKVRADQRETEARLLKRLATRLLSGEPVEKVIESLAQEVVEVFSLARCEICTRFAGARYSAPGATDVFSEPTRIPLDISGERIGQIDLWPHDGKTLDEDVVKVLYPLGAHLALALESVRLSIEVRRVEIEANASHLKAALFSGVTHDVKTPLAVIMAATTSLLDDKGFSEGDRHNHLETIKQESERLHRVVNNLLDLARLRAGSLVARKAPGSIDELIESVVARLRPLLGERPVRIQVDPDMPEIPIDVVQIDQVLTNLVENAIKFSPSGCPITLSVERHDGAIRVTVADRGPGVPPQDRLRMLEPFERGDHPNSGTGLGLAIVDAIITAHGGTFWISEAPGSGAAFTFELPSETGLGEVVLGAGSSSRR